MEFRRSLLATRISWASMRSPAELKRGENIHAWPVATEFPSPLRRYSLPPRLNPARLYRGLQSRPVSLIAFGIRKGKLLNGLVECT